MKIAAVTFAVTVLTLAVAAILILIFWRPNDRAYAITTASGLSNFHRVDSYLFRGAAPTPVGVQTLKNLGVKTIIDFRVNPQMVQAEHGEAQRLGIRYINLPIRKCDVTAQCKQIFFDTLNAAAANPSDGAVFVHCAHGSDRTGFMVALWRVQHDGWSYLAAAQEALHYGFFFHRFMGT